MIILHWGEAIVHLHPACVMMGMLRKPLPEFLFHLQSQTLLQFQTFNLNCTIQAVQATQILHWLNSYPSPPDKWIHFSI